MFLAAELLSIFSILTANHTCNFLVEIHQLRTLQANNHWRKTEMIKRLKNRKLVYSSMRNSLSTSPLREICVVKSKDANNWKHYHPCTLCVIVPTQQCSLPMPRQSKYSTEIQIVSNVLMIPMLKLNHPITEAVASIGISKYSRQYSSSKASYEIEITREQNIVVANLIWSFIRLFMNASNTIDSTVRQPFRTLIIVIRPLVAPLWRGDPSFFNRFLFMRSNSPSFELPSIASLRNKNHHHLHDQIWIGQIVKISHFCDPILRPD